eukprot:s275_g14.t2
MLVVPGSVPASLDEAALYPMGLESRFAYLFDSPTRSHVTTALASQATAEDDAERLRAQWEDDDLVQWQNLTEALERSEAETEMWRCKAAELEDLLTMQRQISEEASSERVGAVSNVSSPEADRAPERRPLFGSSLRSQRETVTSADAADLVLWTPRQDMPSGGASSPPKYGGRDADPDKPIVMGKYKMSMNKSDLLGEGSSSICRKGIDMETGQEVAIKVYKLATKSVNSSEEIRLQKFKRQIQVLKMLQEAFVVPKDQTLWHPDLGKATPSKLFMMLLDYSKDDKGEPSPDPTDGVMYVITEVMRSELSQKERMKRGFGPDPDVVSFGTAMGAFADQKELWEQVLALLDEAVSRKLKLGMHAAELGPIFHGGLCAWDPCWFPGLIAFNAVAAACERGGRWEQTLQVLSAMRGQGPLQRLLPDALGFGAAVAAAAAAGAWAAALQLLEEMEDARHSPNMLVYEAALSAYLQGNCFEKAASEVWLNLRKHAAWREAAQRRLRTFPQAWLDLQCDLASSVSVESVHRHRAGLRRDSLGDPGSYKAESPLSETSPHYHTFNANMVDGNDDTKGISEYSFWECNQRYQARRFMESQVTTEFEEQEADLEEEASDKLASSIVSFWMGKPWYSSRRGCARYFGNSLGKRDDSLASDRQDDCKNSSQKGEKPSAQVPVLSRTDGREALNEVNGHKEEIVDKLEVCKDKGPARKQDYFALKREKNKPLSRESIKACARAILLVVAGLHAKGLVHLDLKPENLMMFNGRLKLIDVDGCVPIDSEVSINDSSISFSPCYCAPEWARFLIDEAESKIIAKPHLDVWSIGITLCELVTLDAILKPMYGNFLRNGHSHREAGFLFMDWLGHITRAPVPKSIERFDRDFHKLIVESLLVCDLTKRKSLAQCLSDPYVVESGKSESTELEGQDFIGSVSASCIEAALMWMPCRCIEIFGEVNGCSIFYTSSCKRQLTPRKVVRQARQRFEDTSSKAPLYKGTLWKLNTDGKAEDATHWLKRDMWVACDGSLCYFSIKENKRLVLLDGIKISGAKVTTLPNAAREFAFQLDCVNSDDHEKDISMCFSAESEQEYQKWRSLLSQASNLEGAMQTIRLGGAVADELKQFRLAVKNRRMKVGEDTKDQFAPIFKAKLWKVKAEGDRKKVDDWFEREMWIAKNGSLVYWSKKEDRELVYYTANDIAQAKFVLIDNEDTFHPWAFHVQLASSGGIEFAPGEFAAESEASRDRWISELAQFKHA